VAAVRTRGVREPGGSARPIQVTTEKEGWSMALWPASCAVREGWPIFLLYDFYGNCMQRRRATYGRIFVWRVKEIERKSSMIGRNHVRYELVLSFRTEI
jgi:hypothetical protein